MINVRVALIQTIEGAFRDVTRGAGTTLNEARAKDDRLSDQEISSARESDKSNGSDWRTIPRENLEQEYASALSFLNVDGFRYYIPCYMTASLEGLFGDASNVFFHLTRINGKSLRASTPEAIAKHMNFNAVQCAAIALYLRFAIDSFSCGGEAEIRAVERWEDFVQGR